MTSVRRTEAAERDLREIARQIAVTDGRAATADRIIDELIDKCNRLAEHSRVAVQGTAAPEIGPTVRIIPHRRWVILFRYEPHGVDILRFADGSQDYLTWKLR